MKGQQHLRNFQLSQVLNLHVFSFFFSSFLCLRWKKIMNKRLKIEVSQSFKSNAMSVYYGSDHEPKNCCVRIKN